MFRRKEDNRKDTKAPELERFAFQTMGGDFAYQKEIAFSHLETVLNNVERYLEHSMKIEFTTLKGLNEKFHDHFHFDKVYKGDMFVYNQENGDEWSGYFGSKPDLKMKIKAIFNGYRATESLKFVVFTEYQKLRSWSKLSPRDEAMSKFLDRQQQLIEGIRTQIAILLHHDAITGTNSKTAEGDYNRIINEATADLNTIQWDLIEKLGRMQSGQVDMENVNNRPTPIDYNKVRGIFQFSVFNPLPVARKDIVTIRVLSNDIQLRNINADLDFAKIKYSLIPTEPKSTTNDVRYFDLIFPVEL